LGTQLVKLHFAAIILAMIFDIRLLHVMIFSCFLVPDKHKIKYLLWPNKR